MPQKQDHPAAVTLALSNASQLQESEPIQAAIQAQIALTHAVLAVASELATLRDKVTEVAVNLEDQDRYSAGMHLRNISDWLEKISERR